MPAPPPAYGSVVPYSHETALLNGSRGDSGSRRSSGITKLVVVFLLAVIVGQNLGYLSLFVNDISPGEKAAIRHQWEAEKTAHMEEVVKWNHDREGHRQDLLRWQDEIEERTEDRKAWQKKVAAERAEEERSHQIQRDAFKKEREGWERERQEDLKAWREKMAAEREKEERQRQIQRSTFEKEREGWVRKRQEDLEAWQEKMEARREEEERLRRVQRSAFEKEREGWAQERQEEERHRKEVQRRAQGVHWSEPWGNSHCSAYGTRAYNAYLLDVPDDINWLEVCNDMPITFHGQPVDHPNLCERDGNRIWATWFIDFDEPQCATYWDKLHDMGCSAGQTGMRRFESRLMNLHRGDGWDEMCRTTPATIRGVHFNHSSICENRNGRTGIWDVPDDRCTQ